MEYKYNYTALKNALCLSFRCLHKVNVRALLVPNLSGHDEKARASNVDGVRLKFTTARNAILDSRCLQTDGFLGFPPVCLTAPSQFAFGFLAVPIDVRF